MDLDYQLHPDISIANQVHPSSQIRFREASYNQFLQFTVVVSVLQRTSPSSNSLGRIPCLQRRAGRRPSHLDVGALPCLTSAACYFPSATGLPPALPRSPPAAHLLPSHPAGGPAASCFPSVASPPCPRLPPPVSASQVEINACQNFQSPDNCHSNIMQSKDVGVQNNACQNFQEECMSLFLTHE